MSSLSLSLYRAFLRSIRAEKKKGVTHIRFRMPMGNNIWGTHQAHTSMSQYEILHNLLPALPMRAWMKDAGQTSRQKHLPFRLTAEDDVDNKGSGCHHDSTSDGDGVSGDVNVGNVAKMKEKETECAITKTVNDDDDEEPEATDVKQSVTIDNDDEYLSLKLTSVRNIVHDYFKYGIQKRDEGISAHEVQTDATASSTTPSPSDTDTDTDTNTSTDTDTGPGAGAGNGDEKSPEEEKHELDIAFGALRVLNAQFDIDRHTSRAVANNTVLVEACGAFSQLLSTQFRTNTFTYRIRVENIGTEPVQLMSREWNINDYADGVHTVSGLGVVGQLPKIEPGDYFEYYSGIQLKGNEGEMHGTFQMVTVEDNNKFEAEVAPFKVNAPR